MYAPDPKLYYSASARISALKDEIASRRRVTYPTEAPKQLLDVLEKSCVRLQSLADLHLADWRQGVKDKSSIEETFGFLNTGIGKIAEYFGIFDSAGFEKAQPEIALPLEILVNHHIPRSKERNHQFIFHATHELNFYYRHFYQDLRKSLMFMDSEEAEDFFRGLPDHIALVSLAALERDNIFSMIVLLHELAHYYDQSQDPVLSQVELMPSNQALKDWVEEAKSIKYVPDFLRRRFPDVTKIPAEVLEFWLRYVIVTRTATARIWMRELLADMVAARMGGFAFYLTLKKFLSLFDFKVGGDYPPNYRRFHAVAQMLFDPSEGIERLLDAERVCAQFPEFRETVSMVISEARKDFKGDDVHADAKRPKPTATVSPEEKAEYLEYQARVILESVIREPLIRLLERIKADFPQERCCALSERILEAARYLIERVPPAQLQGASIFTTANWVRVEEILCAAWLAWLKELVPDEPTTKWTERRNVTSRLALRAIELSDYLRRHVADEKDEVERHRRQGEKEMQDLGEASAAASRAGVVGRRELLAAMIQRPLEERLVIMPLLDAAQIGEASIDLRLGNGFILVRPTRTLRIQVTPKDIRAPGEFNERVSLPYQKEIVLHPGEFILGSALEYICLPRDMMAYVIGRSSLGRLGLIIATATHVAPGYKGTLTLELSNVGTVPVELQPRIPIAQLVFHSLREPVETPYHKRGSFTYSTGPTMPKLGYF